MEDKKESTTNDIKICDRCKNSFKGPATLLFYEDGRQETVCHTCWVRYKGGKK